MKCLDDCHTYELDFVLNPVTTFMHFYEMRPDGTKIDGVTNEEVLRVLIHRLKYLNESYMDGKFRCPQNTIAILCLKWALGLLEARTDDRKARGIEGSMEP